MLNARLEKLIQECIANGGQLLDLNKRYDVTDESLQRICERLPSLTELYFCNNDKVTDNGLIFVANKLPKLTKIDFSWCDNITDVGLIAVANNLHNLTLLDFARSNNITDDSLIAVANNLPNLIQLDFSGCNYITNAGLTAVANKLPDLTYLDFSGCNRITDEGLIAIANNLPDLTQLDFSGCNRITDEGLIAVANKLPDLTYLDFSDCNKITNDGFRKLAEAFRAGKLKDLQVLSVTGTQISLDDSILATRNPEQIFRAYWESRSRDAKSLDEVKLLIVGQGEVGKTHLRKRLFSEEQSQPHYHNEAEQRTPDFEFGRWSGLVTNLLGQQTEKKYRVWDFGGQSHLHGTHRFFLGSDHGIYLLMLDATQSANHNRLDYWLRLIAHHGTSSQVDENSQPLKAPVLIVLNKCDLVSFASKQPNQQLASTNSCRLPAAQVNANHQDLLLQLTTAKANGWYGANVISEPIIGLGICPTTKSTSMIEQAHLQAIEDIKSAILQATSQIVGRDRKFAKAFYDLKDWIEGEFHDAQTGVIRYLKTNDESFREVFNQAQVEEAYLNDWLQRLRDLGIIHWAGDLEQIKRDLHHEFQHLVFNPAWVKYPVYQLIQTPQGQHERGWVKHGTIDQRLTDFVVADRKLVLKLILTCGLACEFTEGKLTNGLLIPDLLEQRTKNLDSWKTNAIVANKLTFDFVPEKTFLEFVKKKYLHIQDVEINCWRNQIEYTHRSLQDTCQVFVQSHVCPGNGERPYILIAAYGGQEKTCEQGGTLAIQEIEEIFKDDGLTVGERENCLPEQKQVEQKQVQPRIDATKNKPTTPLEKVKRLIESLELIEETQKTDPSYLPARKEIAKICQIDAATVTRYFTGETKCENDALNQKLLKLARKLYGKDEDNRRRMSQEATDDDEDQ